MTHKRQCPECDRVFDLLDDDDASEWAYGHDCEPDPVWLQTARETAQRLNLKYSPPRKMEA